MDEKNPNGPISVDVTLKADERIGNPAGTLCFMFATLSFLFWANMMGFLGPDAQIVLGLIQLGVYGAYHICSQDLYKIGAGFDGTVFMIFAAMFAGVGGLMNVGGAICAFVGMPFSAVTPGVIWLMSGLILLLVLPSAAKSPLVGFLFYIFGGVGLVLMGLLVLGFLGAEFVQPIAWLLFCAGACGLLVSVATMNGFNGINIPLGPVISK